MSYLCKAGAADVSDVATTDQWLIDSPKAGTIRVDSCFIALTEATGAMTVDGVISLKVAGNEVGTVTLTDAAAIGATFAFVPDGTYATTTNPIVEFAAGDDILVEIKTAATVETTGDGDVYLDINFGF